MTISYTLDEDDFVTHLLFTASKSARVKRSLLLSKTIPPIVLLILAFVYFLKGSPLAGIPAFLFAILWFFFYPYREKNRYVKHYHKFVRETYKERVSRIITCEFASDHVYLKDNGSESKIQLSELAEINEINKLILIKLKAGVTIVIPKSKIEDIESIKSELLKIASKLNIDYRTDLNWKWS